ncbi:MAG: hypothetical protein ABIH55_01735 [Nanoarchaeota archaeon]
MERDGIGKKSFGQGNTGKAGFGKPRTEDNIRQQRERAYARTERSRDRARQSLLASRRRLKDKVKENEEKTVKRKALQPRNLNPTAVPTIPSKVWEKMRKSANLSTVPLEPKYSRAKTHRERVYGKKFEGYEPDSSVFYGRRDLKQEIQEKLEMVEKPPAEKPREEKPKEEKREEKEKEEKPEPKKEKPERKYKKVKPATKLAKKVKRTRHRKARKKTGGKLKAKATKLKKAGHKKVEAYEPDSDVFYGEMGLKREIQEIKEKLEEPERPEVKVTKPTKALLK